MKKYTEQDWLFAFWSRVNKQGAYPHKKACEVYPEIAGTRCWEWVGTPAFNGYGQCVFRGKLEKAHRIAWMIKYGRIPKKKQICHKCDNRKCVRHLFKGTHQDNVIDMFAKKRESRGLSHSLATKKNRPNFKGELHPRATLSDKQVIKIRKMYVTGNYTYKDLAILFNINRGSAYNIITSRSYSHI